MAICLLSLDTAWAHSQLEFGDKLFTLDLAGRVDTVAVDRL